MLKTIELCEGCEKEYHEVFRTDDDVLLCAGCYVDLLKAELAKLNYIELPNENVSNVFEAYLAWKSKATALLAENVKLNLGAGICEWEREEDNDIWMTSCSNAWDFTNDGPKENDCHYCMYCGGVLEVIEGEPDVKPIP